MEYQHSYESMFGSKEYHVTPNFQALNLNEALISQVMDKARNEKKWVILFFIGTKPCFYKFHGSIVAAERYDIPHLVINANQHYDDTLVHGLKEFNINVAANLLIKGSLAERSSELILKVHWLAKYLSKNWPSVTVVPMVLGDTILTPMVPLAWMFSRNEKCIHNEAGLRGMAPIAIRDLNKLDINSFINAQFYGKWELVRHEPFPEQWDTYVAAAGSEFHFAPTELNREHLLREGYPSENIWVTGGVVVDALELKLKENIKNSIFNIYPQLEQGEWIRVDIHRRGNITPMRFKAIIGAVKSLVNKGYNINFIEMNATKYALEEFKLRNELELLKKSRNFLMTEIWPEYSHVVEFFRSKHFFTALTDSGGVQEELNLLQKPCLTARFNTDRPETVMDARTNLLVPPISASFMAGMVEHFYKDQNLYKRMADGKKMYGENVGDKTMQIIKKLMNDNVPTFKWAHHHLGFKDEDTEFKFL